MRHKLSKGSVVQVGLTALALGVVLVAPVAAPSSGSSDAVTISGARSLSDTVSVSFNSKADKDKTTDVHLLAFNDLHGTLDPAGQNICG